jgi:hypothetical protein
MNNRERALAILNYQDYDHLPVVHFGFWSETLQKWAAEGHLTAEEADAWSDGNPADIAISEKLGFDFNWASTFGWHNSLYPGFAEQILEELPDGGRKVLNEDGAIVLQKSGVVSIPTEIDHLLKDRRSWETIFLPRLQFSMERITTADVHLNARSARFDRGGEALLRAQEPDQPYGLFCGSLLGTIRNWLGLVGLSYLMVDDPALLDEILATMASLEYQGVKTILEMGLRFDFAHFWEDICYKSGPLVSPIWFKKQIGPFYSRITDLLLVHDIRIVSVDCDGKIDGLIPTWVENGVNTMFPIEVGTWNADIRPWRQKFGQELRGVGGVNKVVFARDYAAIDAEIERLRPLVDLGGYIPCIDHRLAPDARWENVQYYCQRIRQVFK